MVTDAQNQFSRTRHLLILETNINQRSIKSYIICKKQFNLSASIMSEKISLLFLCTGNSCRSQMAEGFARHFHNDKYDIYSAGIEKHGMNEFAMQVMQEAGTPINQQYSKTTEELPSQEIDFVITVCGHADENCPYFPAKTKVLHNGFDDPPKLALQVETEEEKLDCYRKVRDEVKVFCEKLPEYLKS